MAIAKEKKIELKEEPTIIELARALKEGLKELRDEMREAVKKREKST